jgi:exosome complex component RRP43
MTLTHPSIHRRRTHLLPDPTSFEEPLLDTSITIIMNHTGEIISTRQAGPGLTLTPPNSSSNEKEGSERKGTIEMSIEMAKRRFGVVKEYLKGVLLPLPEGEGMDTTS